MSVLNNELFVKFQDAVLDFPVFPALWIPHCIMMSLALRNTLGGNWQGFSRQHPMSCFILAILYTFPGGILATAMLAQPVLSFMLNTPFVLAMMGSWYLVFYSPNDLFFQLVTKTGLILPFSGAQDFLRLHLVLSGVQTIHQLHPGSFFYPVVFAICKSSGFMFLKYAEYILANGLKQAFVIPHHSTKTCILASIVLTLQSLGHLPIDIKPLFAILVCISLSFRLLTVLSNWDPYQAFENVFCAIAFGRPIENAPPSKKKNKKED